MPRDAMCRFPKSNLFLLILLKQIMQNKLQGYPVIEGTKQKMYLHSNKNREK